MRVFTREGGRQESQRRRYDHRNRCQGDAIAGRWPQAKESMQHLEVRNSKEQILPWSIQKENNPANTLP
jgi:hypothetical protein